jgi:flagellar hook-basal body complex protein FliE
MTTVNNAITAYANTAKQLSGGAEAQPVSGVSFGDMLEQGMKSAIDAQHNSEKVSAAAVMGNANMTDVLQAVNNAELALNAVLAIRDKLVQAYESLERTQI